MRIATAVLLVTSVGGLHFAARPRPLPLARPGIARCASARLAAHAEASSNADGCGRLDGRRKTLPARLYRWATPLERPPRAPSWAPDWCVCLRPWLQLCVLLAFYTCHLLLCTLLSAGWFTHPTTFALFMFISLETVAGCLLFLALGARFLRSMRAARSFSGVGGAERAAEADPERLPWRVPPSVRAKLPGVTCALVVQYAFSGQVNSALHGLLCALRLPLSEMCVGAAAMLCSHALWVAMAIYTLSSQLRPFWPREGGRWLVASWRSLWVHWALAGYAASLAVYKVADEVACQLLPASPSAGLRVLGSASLVQRLTDRAAGGGPLALALGALAPCVSAPVFEEVLYRAFLLTALSAYLPVGLALPLQGLLFGAHHLDPRALLQLASLGSLWAAVYLCSRNLLVCVLIHLLWNSRAFLCAFGWG